MCLNNFKLLLWNKQFFPLKLDFSNNIFFAPEVFYEYWSFIFYDTISTYEGICMKRSLMAGMLLFIGWYSRISFWNWNFKKPLFKKNASTRMEKFQGSLVSGLAKVWSHII